MARNAIPQVINDYLHLAEQNVNAPPVAVGSQCWYTWLADVRNKSFSFKGHAGTFTARHERQRNSWYWYAYHKHQGKTRKAYLGKPEELTAERLSTIASALVTPKLRTSVQPEKLMLSLNANNAHAGQDGPERNMEDYLEKLFLLHSLILQMHDEYPGVLTLLSQLLAMNDADTHPSMHGQEDALGKLLAQLQAIDKQPLASTSTTLPLTSAKNVLQRFTDREREVLELLLHGATNRVISRQLVISEGTVKKHVANICGKLNVKSRTQAMAIVFSWLHEA